jgi:hypothetical protein
MATRLYMLIQSALGPPPAGFYVVFFYRLKKIELNLFLSKILIAAKTYEFMSTFIIIAVKFGGNLSIPNGSRITTDLLKYQNKAFGLVFSRAFSRVLI